ncbi:hypothetical protein [Poseidonocella sp. HB161398]|uniref:hypothetical protein n=1 Tax=Poseidonocella sp. HB161398 TaxID=2320855 RepID=UPI001108BC8C|nr:hypothetical protein [Poseidonocella sp. HB161398]
MTEMEIERLLWSWPRVIERAESGWERDFAKSIYQQARRPKWMPSPKQANLMRSMVAGLYRPNGGGCDVIDPA